MYRKIAFLLSNILLFSILNVSHAQVVVQRCDITTNWESSNTLSLDYSDKKEGQASMQATGNGTDWFKKVFSQIHTGIDETGYFSFWLYVSDVSLFSTDGQVEISSSGNPDADEYNWSVASIGLSNGWNDVKLAISDAETIGNPSLDSIDYFRIYQPVSASISVKIDFIRFTKTETPVEPDNILDINEVDKSTLDGKVMFGYQGWFSAQGDGSQLNKFNHWGPLETGSGKPEELSVDMWFDDREFDLDELYKTGYQYPDGRNAKAFSSYNKKTVFRHMKWLRDYNLDGVFLQRFLTNVQIPEYKDLRDSAAVHVMEGSERYGRAFVMMYDGLDFENSVERLKEDWIYLVDELKLTESPAYLHHRGRPLVSLWGFSLKEGLSVADLEELINFFHNNPVEKYRASIKIGCHQDWISSEQWKTVFKNVEVVSPWTVGRYNDKASYESFARTNIIPAQEWCDQNNVDFMPVNWPGFSWYNLHDGPKNQIPRRGGQYFWDQVSGNLTRGAKSLYIAMFDEVDEATAMFKLPENKSQSPDTGYFLELDADGFDLPGDWYLRCASKATQVVKGNMNNTTSLDTPPDGIDAFSVKAAHAYCGLDNGVLVIRYPHTDANPIIEFSIDGGQSYPYTTSVSSDSMIINNLSPATYNLWVRFEDDSYPTDLGDRTIFDTVPEIALNPSDTSLEIRFNDRHYLRSLEVSLDSGATYAYQLSQSEYRLFFEEYASPDTFKILYKVENAECFKTGFYEAPAISKPYMEHSIPGLIEAEHYDIGGEGVAYHETDDTHTGNADYRKDESVDIGVINDPDGGLFMGWNDNGEWVKYTITNVQGGIYDVKMRVASPSSSKFIELLFDEEVIGRLTVPNTGGYHTFEVATMKNVIIPDKNNVKIKLYHSNALNIDYFEFVDPVYPDKATSPDPADGAVDVPVSKMLRWTEGANTVSNDVYLGVTNPPGFLTNQGFTFISTTLEYNTTYYWRVDEVSGPLVTEGDVWSFTTVANTDLSQHAHDGDDIRIYPNPVVNRLNIEFNTTILSNVNITLYDIYGRIILNQPDINTTRNISIPLDNVTSGSYTVKITGDGFYDTKMIFVK